MHTGFVLSFGLKVMISSCQHFYNNLSFTGILNRLIFDRVYDSWILSLLLCTLGFTVCGVFFMNWLQADDSCLEFHELPNS